MARPDSNEEAEKFVSQFNGLNTEEILALQKEIQRTGRINGPNALAVAQAKADLTIDPFYSNFGRVPVCVPIEHKIEVPLLSPASVESSDAI